MCPYCTHTCLHPSLRNSQLDTQSHLCSRSHAAPLPLSWQQLVRRREILVVKSQRLSAVKCEAAVKVASEKGRGGGRGGVGPKKKRRNLNMLFHRDPKPPGNRVVPFKNQKYFRKLQEMTSPPVLFEWHPVPVSTWKMSFFLLSVH